MLNSKKIEAISNPTKIGLFRSMWWKKETPQWHWYYRFKKPLYEVNTSGCFDDAHNFKSSEGCPCNNFNYWKEELTRKGFRIVAHFEGLQVWANEDQEIALEHILYGR